MSVVIGVPRRFGLLVAGVAVVGVGTPLVPPNTALPDFDAMRGIVYSAHAAVKTFSGNHARSVMLALQTLAMFRSTATVCARRSPRFASHVDGRAHAKGGATDKLGLGSRFSERKTWTRPGFQFSSALV
jgi:hypothetical protein